MGDLVNLAKRLIRNQSTPAQGERPSTDQSHSPRMQDVVPGAVGHLAMSASVPLKAGWRVVYRNRQGRLTQGTVQRMQSSPEGWIVVLQDGQTIPARHIDVVSRIEQGATVASWQAKEHGLGGPPQVPPPLPRDPQEEHEQWLHVWRELATLTRGIDETDPRFRQAWALLENCDECFLGGDWPGFQKHVKEIQTLLRRN